MPPKPSPWPSLMKAANRIWDIWAKFPAGMKTKSRSWATTLPIRTVLPISRRPETVLLCRKLSATRITADQFIDPEIEKKWYADGDMHTMYIGEMIGVLKKQ